MKVLLINGSPKKEGCTYTALSEVAKELEEQGIETEIFHVGSKAVQGCLGCGYCSKSEDHLCVYKEDPLNEAIIKAREADGFVFGSPVHYAAASGALTSFLDRLFWSTSRSFAFKPGAAVVSCRRGGSTAALDQINKYFTFANMPVVSSRYWNMVHGTTPEEVRQDLEGMQIMRTIGKNMAWMLKCIEAGKSAGIEKPEIEKKISTNFIR